MTDNEDIKNRVKNDEDLDITDLFTDKDEKKKAKSLMHKYLAEYTIETISDKNTLKDLIYLEVINNRLQSNLNEIHTETQGTPWQTVKTIHDNLSQIQELKSKLGITKDKKALDQTSGYGYLMKLKDKYKNWLLENQASRYMICPHCGKSVLLKLNMKHWEAQKHPYFKDRILGNTHLIELYKQKKLTKEDLSKIFDTSTDYVDWLVERWNVVPQEEAVEETPTQDNKESS